MVLFPAIETAVIDRLLTEERPHTASTRRFTVVSTSCRSSSRRSAERPYSMRE